MYGHAVGVAMAALLALALASCGGEPDAPAATDTATATPTPTPAPPLTMALCENIIALWEMAWVTTDVVPEGGPCLVTVSDGSETELMLEWAGGPADATKWQYRQRTFRQPWPAWVDIPGSGADTVRHRVSGLEADSGYFFEVRAWTEAGPWTESNEADGATPYRSYAGLPGMRTGQVSEGGRTWILGGSVIVDIPIGVRVMHSSGALSGGTVVFTMSEIESMSAQVFDLVTGEYAGRVIEDAGAASASELNALFDQILDSARLVPTAPPAATPEESRMCEQGTAVPNAADNTVLVEDCGALLALKATLAGTGTLNWSPDIKMADWDGVVVGGSPPRVVELQLAGSGLTGELSGLLGNLPELTTLRLEGNLLTGTIPSKLANLDNLTDLRLGGNPLRGCVPFSLQGQATNDLASLGLPDCDPPIDISSGDDHTLTEGSYQYIRDYGSPPLTFDVPDGLQLELDGLVYEARLFDEDGTLIRGSYGLILRVAGSESWIGLDAGMAREWKRWPDEPDEETARLFDRIVESAWLDWPR